MPRQRLRPIATLALGIGALALLSGCAVPLPEGPTFLALPAKGKPYDRFRDEDQYCRGQAFAADGGVTAGQASARSGLASAGIGTVVGAAAGALIGAAVGAPGAGAAIGAGSGLAFGGLSGAGTANASAYELQRRYDNTYAQCMVAYGNLVPLPQGPAYAPPVVAYGPTVGIGLGVGYGGFGY